MPLREVADFLSDITYLHLVPQLLRFGEKMGGHRLTDDPFGQGFLEHMGHPHLEARYAHHRPNAGWQSEEHFSDGTPRLFGLLWALREGSSMLLLEEPEISLNDAIVKEIPFQAATWRWVLTTCKSIKAKTSVRSSCLQVNPIAA
jgi:hypothetical protein